MEDLLYSKFKEEHPTLTRLLAGSAKEVNAEPRKTDVSHFELRSSAFVLKTIWHQNPSEHKVTILFGQNPQTLTGFIQESDPTITISNDRYENVESQDYLFKLIGEDQFKWENSITNELLTTDELANFWIEKLKS